MQTWLLGLAIVGVSVLVAHVGLRLVRHAVPLPVHETQHEVGGFIIGVMGAIYAVLLAFVVVAVWDEFSDAKARGREGGEPPERPLADGAGV